MRRDNKKLIDFVIPSIDLLDGKVVRLKQGDYNNKTIYKVQIDELLEKYKPFSNLHIVNLNGAKDEKKQKNEDIIKKIRHNFNNKIQVGGGIRNIEIADYWLNKIGVNRVVIGTLCIKNIKETKTIIDKFGEERVVLALDCQESSGVFYPKINGWTEFEDNKMDIFAFLKEYENIAKYILITDINNDGMMCGGNIELYRNIKKVFPNFQVQASGGVGGVCDVKNLLDVSDFAIIGKAFYENKDILNEVLCFNV